ncbi:DUF3488 and transglutaminase-like domain-containing protein [uncultured Halomonas sp.]|uniref:transglutaminase TgpA family protein n=1 Tax=uncultured Halomonas sp. TaxID=173971 RepID=UPI002611BC47|nr:DUF3488 and transglutaminase-like domain-containing protein [uncultured Halomonas sp.]
MSRRAAGAVVLADGHTLSASMLRRLFVGQCLVLALHLTYMPVWLGGLGALVAGYRYLQLRRRLPRAGVVLRLVGVAALAGGLWLHYGTLGRMEAMIGLLLGVYLLKLLETHSRRDARVVVLIGMVATTVAFLHSQGIAMAAVALLAVAWLIYSLVWLAGAANARQAWHESAWLLGLAAPLMVLLFLGFPRFGPLWNLPQADRAATGLTDEIAPGDIADLSRSDRRAFRARFEGDEPAPGERYWRVYTLSEFDGERWRRTSPSRFATALKQGESPWVAEGGRSPWSSVTAPRFEAELLLEPDRRPWRPSLGTPQVSGERLRWLADGTVEGLTPLASRGLLHLSSSGMAPSWLEPQGMHRHTRLPAEGNPRSRELAQRLWQQAGGEPRAFLAALMSRFGEAPFRYTLSPPRLTSRDRVDEFLFESHAGYCTHYASAMAVLARSVGLPARIVAGFLGGERHPDGHFTVRDYDAHAWVEVWLDGSWRRLDPTAAIAPERIEQGAAAVEGAGDAYLADAPFSPLRLRGVGWVNRLRLDWERLEYRWQRGVIGYRDEARSAVVARVVERLQALWNALQDQFSSRAPLTWLMSLVLTGVGLCGLLVGLRAAWRRHREGRDEALRIRRLQAWLTRRGMPPHGGESPAAHLRRLAGSAEAAGPALRDCAHQFERLRYARLGPDERRSRRQTLGRRVAEVKRHLASQERPG